MAYVDDRSTYGMHKPGPVTAFMIGLTRSLGESWMARRAVFTLRKTVLPFLGLCTDSELWGARVRLYTSGNLCEKRALFAPQLFERTERRMIAELAGPDAVFVDIGANVGLYSLSVASAFRAHDGARVVAAEPHPDLHRRLAFHAKLNPDLPIAPVEAAVTDHEGRVRLETGADNLGQNRIGDGGVEVRATTLLGLAEREGLKAITALKVDVEGAEGEVLLPFFRDAPDPLLPRLLIYEGRRPDIDEAAQTRGYRLARTTRMNTVLERPEAAARRRAEAAEIRGAA